jgi:hypothetical protein
MYTDFIDKDKVPADDTEDRRIVIDGDTDVEDVMSTVDGILDSDGDTSVQYIGKDGKISQGADALDAFSDDIDGDDLSLDEEVLQMFRELASGKDYILEKDLRKWDELDEVVDSGLADRGTIDSYVSKLNIQNGKIDFDGFKEFMAMVIAVFMYSLQINFNFVLRSMQSWWTLMGTS